MMLIAVVIQLVQWHINNYTEWKALCIRIFSHIFMVQTWIPEQTFYFSLNGLSWYLSTILFCYLCFPLLLRLLIKFSTVKAAFLSLISVFILQISIALISQKVFNINASDYYYLTYVCPLFRIFDFICGSLLAVIFIKFPATHKSILQHTVWEVIAVFAVGIAQFIALHTDILPWTRFGIIFLPSSCFAILVFSIGGGYISKIFSTKIVTLFAGLTPFIFLIHHRIIDANRALFSIFNISNQKYLVAIISFFITIFLSYLYNSFRTLRIRKK